MDYKNLIQRTFYFLFFSFILINISLAQKNIMIELDYNPDVQISNKVFINKVLHNLKSTNNNEKIFNNILWLDDLKTKHATLRRVLDYYDPKKSISSVFLSEEELIYSDTVLQKITNIDYWLKISIEGNTSSHQNYTFSLHESKRGNIDYTQRIIIYPQVTTDKSLNSEHCLYKIDDHDNSELKNTIKRLFKESVNSLPTLVVLVNSIPYSNDTIVMSLKDSILIDLSKSDDLDTRRKDLVFKWIQYGHLNHINPPEEMNLNLEDNVIKQYIVPSKKGVYQIRINVNDGINSSNEESVFIEVIDAPILLFEKTKHSEYTKISYLQYLFKPKKFNRKVDDIIEASLENYPNSDWSINIVDANRVFAKKSTRKRILNITVDSLDDLDYKKRISLKGKIKRKESFNLFFQAKFRNQTSNIVRYKIQKPYLSYVEEINVGIRPIYFSVIRKDSVLNYTPITPVGAEVNLPLFYRPGKNNYNSFTFGVYPLLIDRKSKNNGNFGVVTIGYRENHGFQKHDHSLYFGLGFVAIINGINQPDRYQAYINLSGFKWNFKYVSFSTEILNLHFNINPFDVIFGVGLKMNLLEWYNHSNMPIL